MNQKWSKQNKKYIYQTNITESDPLTIQFLDGIFTP